MQDHGSTIKSLGLLPHLQAFSGVQAGIARALRPQQTLGRIGNLEVRLAQNAAEIRQAQKLRYRVFYQEGTALADPSRLFARRDIDAFDAICDHLLVLDHATLTKRGKPVVVGTYRLLRQQVAEDFGGFYTASEYDIAPMLNGLPADTKFLELGRSCVLKSYRARPGTMQLLWKGLMAYVARFDIDVMFGCASFPGIDPETMALPLSYLHYHHPMPEVFKVSARPERYVSMNLLPSQDVHAREGIRALPAILKGYVRAGCCIGDGAVIDEQFDTTDVFIFFPLSGIDARYKSRFGLVK